MRKFAYEIREWLGMENVASEPRRIRSVAQAHFLEDMGPNFRPMPRALVDAYEAHFALGSEHQLVQEDVPNASIQLGLAAAKAGCDRWRAYLFWRYSRRQISCLGIRRGTLIETPWSNL